MLVNFLNKLKIKLGLLGELFSFLWKQKLWWLIPMVVVLVVFGLLLIVAQGSTVIHFIYPLF